MNETINVLKSHRSIRKFTQQNIPQETVNEIVRCGQSAATSSFIQACTAIQINDQVSRDKLTVYAGNQDYVSSASVFLVFCADMQRHHLACEINNQSMQSGFTEQFLTASLDCALFAQNVVIAAESLGLGAVYIGGLRNNIQDVADCLKLPDLVYPVFGLCLGYPDQNPDVKPRLPLTAVLKQDTYNGLDDRQLIKEYDQEIKEYYASRGANIKQQGWSEQISNMLSKESRVYMLSFLQAKGFLKK